jgi:FAD/FMN-containing dehydrogenase
MGFPIKNIFVGSEGYLGIITKLRIMLVNRPKSTSLALIRVTSFDSVKAILKSARVYLGDDISAFEFFDTNSIESVSIMQPQLLKGLELWLSPMDNVDDVDDSSVGADTNSNTDTGINGPINILVQISSTSADIQDSSNKIEIEVGNNAMKLQGQLENWVIFLMNKGLVLEKGTIIAQNKAQEKLLWGIREAIPVCLMKQSQELKILDSGAKSRSEIKPASASASASTSASGRLYKYDISLTLSQMNEIVHKLKIHLIQNGYFINGCTIPKIASTSASTSTPTANTNKSKSQSQSQDYKSALNISIANFGHCGDLNLHINILVTLNTTKLKLIMNSTNTSSFLNKDKHEQKQKHIEDINKELSNLQMLLDDVIAKEVSQRNGSLSAEHGVGQLKRRFMNLARTPEELFIMRGFKSILDPNGILNPGVMLPDE